VTSGFPAKQPSSQLSCVSQPATPNKMSDDEDQSDVEETQEEESQPTEAELALKKRREAQRQTSSHGLDEAARELLETNEKDRERMEDEINELRKRNAKRKVEREQLEKRLAAQRAAEEDRRRTVEEEKKKKKEEEEQKRRQARAQKQAEFEKEGTTGKRNFVISASKKDDEEADEAEEEVGVVKKSKEQLEAEKKAILKQRIQPLGEVSGLEKGALADKAKELHKAITKLEGEKYDLEKRYKVQQVDMMELAERARQANKVGKGGLKRVQQSEEIDKIQATFAGAPAKIEMYSKYERQKDKRSYAERHKVHSGPQFLRAASRIEPSKIVKWGDDGLPRYEEVEGAAAEGGGH